MQAREAATGAFGGRNCPERPAAPRRSGPAHPWPPGSNEQALARYFLTSCVLTSHSTHMLPFTVEFRTGLSLYQQLVYAVQKAIISGQLLPGDRFPSVRKLSQELRINPNTAQKVVTRLVDQGLLEVKPGVGTRVARLPEASQRERSALLDHEAEALVVEARRAVADAGTGPGSGSRPLEWSFESFNHRPGEPRQGRLDMNAIIETHQLTRRFGKTLAVRNLSLQVPEGSVFAFLGPNGAGKTTVIKMLMNMIRPTSGTARMLGTDSLRLSPAQLARIGYVSENQEMLEWMTVQQLIDYCRPMYPTWDPDLCRQLIRQFELPLNRKLKTFSRGMKVKASLLSSLSYRPELVILDEPFTGLDALVRDEFIRGLLELSGRSQWTILVASHDIDEVERLADWVGVIDKGEKSAGRAPPSRCRPAFVNARPPWSLAGSCRRHSPIPGCWRRKLGRWFGLWTAATGRKPVTRPFGVLCRGSRI